MTALTRSPLLSSVQNALRILNLFSPQTKELSLAEIASQTGINKSSVHRLLTHLEEEGFVEKDNVTRRYRLGLSLLQLSGVVLSHLEIHHAAKHDLELLAEKTGKYAHLGIIENGELVYLRKIEGKEPITLTSFIGRSNPAYCTGCGKIILAYQPEITETVIENGLTKYGPHCITDPDQLRSDLERIAVQGFAICVDEIYEGVISIAAPVRDFTGNVIAGISVVGLKHQFKQNEIAETIPLVVNAGWSISNQLGYHEGFFNFS